MHLIRDYSLESYIRDGVSSGSTLFFPVTPYHPLTLWSDHLFESYIRNDPDKNVKQIGFGLDALLRVSFGSTLIIFIHPNPMA